MPTVNVDFENFSSSGSFGQIPWSSPGSAETANGVYTTAALSSSSTTTELLVCTGADLSSIPATAAIQSVKLVIKGKSSANNSAQIFEIFAYDGSTTQGRNQGVSWTGSADANTNEIDLDTSNTEYRRGAAGWKWWWLSRLQAAGNGVAIRAKWLSGTPTVSVDHVQFEITYVELFQKWPVVDYRTIAYDRLAGGTQGSEENENGQRYQPTTIGTGQIPWHTAPEAFLDELISIRTGKGIKRLVLGTPAGKWLLDGSNLVPSAQWEPMFNDQRVALTKVIPNWLKGDPEREAILYLGTKVPADPNNLTMVGAVDPDVNNTTHTDKLKRTFFPYRDLVGIRRFLLDNSSVIFQSDQDFREKREAFFAWGRENGMEFVMEAIPHTSADLHEEITEVYSAYALAGFIIDGDPNRAARDPDMEWEFTKGRLLVQVNSGHFDGSFGHDFSTEVGKRRFFQLFAREGYVLMPRDKAGGIDDAAQVVGSEHIGRGVSFGASSSVSFGVANSVTRFVEGSRKGL